MRANSRFEGIQPGALLSAGVVSYARAFVSSVRSYKLDIDVVLRGVPEAEAFKATHEEVLGLRNSFVAHALGGYESELIALVLAGDPPSDIVHVHSWHRRMQTRWQEDVIRWQNLAATVHNVLALEYEELKQQLRRSISPEIACAFSDLLLDPTAEEQSPRKDSRQGRRRRDRRRK